MVRISPGRWCTGRWASPRGVWRGVASSSRGRMYTLAGWGATTMPASRETNRGLKRGRRSSGNNYRYSGTGRIIPLN